MKMRHGKAVARAAIFLIGLVGAVAVFATGFLPDPYLMYMHNIAQPHAYPLDVVLWLLLLITVQGLLSYAIVRPVTYRRSGWRAWATLLLALPFCLFAILSSMHAPPPVVAYIYWSFAVIVLALVLALWSSVAAVCARLGLR